MIIAQAKTIAVKKIGAAATAFDEFAKKTKNSPWIPRVFIGIIAIETIALFFGCTLIQDKFLRATAAIGITLLIAGTLQFAERFTKET